MQEVFAEFSLRKQEWRNLKEGRVGCLHQDIFTRKVTDISFTSDFCNNYSHSASPASLYLTSPRPILDVLKSLVSRPQVPSPHTRVPMSPSPCPRPTFIHSPTSVWKDVKSFFELPHPPVLLFGLLCPHLYWAEYFYVANVVKVLFINLVSTQVTWFCSIQFKYTCQLFLR